MIIPKAKSLTCNESVRCSKWSAYIWNSHIKPGLDKDLNINDTNEPVVMAMIERLFHSAFYIGWISKHESECNQDFLRYRSDITGYPYTEEKEDPNDSEWRSDNLEEDIQAFEEWVGRNYIKN